MPKNPKITDEAKLLIQQFYKRHPRWKAKDIQIRVSQVLHSRNPGLPPGWPGLSSVQKALAKIKNRDPDPRDKPWSFSSLAEYPIAPEAMPLVVSIYDKCCRDSNFSEEWLPTIREVLWIGRLHKIIEFYKSTCLLPDVRDEVSHRIIHKQKWPDELGEHPRTSELALAWGIKGRDIPFEDIVLEWAYMYSQYEAMSEIEGESFDIRELDGYMMADVYEFYGDRRNAFIDQIEEEYGVDTDKLEALNLSIGDIEQAAIQFKFQARIFYVPKTEVSVIKELKELKIAGWGWSDGLVYLKPNKDAPNELLRKMEKYEVNIKKEAQIERSYSQEVQE